MAGVGERCGEKSTSRLDGPTLVQELGVELSRGLALGADRVR